MAAQSKEPRSSGSIISALREISASAWEVWRNMAVLELVGVLRVMKGKGSASSSCELCDLKDAAEALGAVYNARRSSFVTPDGRARVISDLRRFSDRARVEFFKNHNRELVGRLMSKHSSPGSR